MWVDRRVAAPCGLRLAVCGPARHWRVGGQSRPRREAENVQWQVSYPTGSSPRCGRQGVVTRHQEGSGELMPDAKTGQELWRAG